MRTRNYFHTELRVLWLLVRLPAFTLLAILALVVRFLLGSLALLGVLMAIFWKLVGRGHSRRRSLRAASREAAESYLDTY